MNVYISTLFRFQSLCYHKFMEDALVIREVRNSRDSEETAVAMEQVLDALGSQGSSKGLFSSVFGGSEQRFFSFEIGVFEGVIHFYVVSRKQDVSYLEGQLTSQYPKLSLTPVSDYIGRLLLLPHAAAQLSLTNPFYVPLKTYKDVRDVDLLSSVVGHLGKLDGQQTVIQIRIVPAGRMWQQAARSIIQQGIPDSATPGKTKPHPQAKIIETKISQTGFIAALRILTTGNTEEGAKNTLYGVAGTYGVYSNGDGNTLTLVEPHFWQKKKLEEALRLRSGALVGKHAVFGSSELASLWHPPGERLASIKNIAWGGRLTGEPPENLPTPQASDDQKKEINFFARTEFKNSLTTFGIKKDDRRKHVYIVGKTGTGKSTMIANMAINDMRNREGVAVVDPHGDLIDVLLEYVPSHRINDIVYLDPMDERHAFHLNPFELKNDTHRELVASGIVSIFYKLYHYSWGPRLEYILRNTILTLLYVPDSTLLQIPELLANEKYREKVVNRLEDRVLKNFWVNEFNKMSPQMKSESIMPILNKVGQFLSSKTVRNIVSSPHSTVDLEDIMNEGKIVLVNLSQGKIGEDNSALLGAMIITKIQLAVMNRVYQKEEERRDFYLYVDEFQNFATNSFVKILSEARKYRLNLTLANQYIGQIDEEVQNAIFGNAGTIVSFGVGATDARPLAREFGMVYKEEELVGLGNYQIVLKLSIDNHTSTPFSATTLPLPRSHNSNREKVIRGSRERYYKKI